MLCINFINISAQQGNTKEKLLKTYSFSRKRKSDKIKIRTKNGGQMIR